MPYFTYVAKEGRTTFPEINEMKLLDELSNLNVKLTCFIHVHDTNDYSFLFLMIEFMLFFLFKYLFLSLFI